MKNNKDKEIRLRVDKDFIGKVDYLQRINDYKNRSDTVRKVVGKEWRKEQTKIVDDDVCIGCKNKRMCDKQPWYYQSFNKANCERQEKEKSQERAWFGNDVAYDFTDCEHYKDGICEVFNYACSDEVACNIKSKKR